MIPPIYAKMGYSAIYEVFNQIGVVENFTKGQIRLLAANVKWQVQRQEVEK